MFGVCEACKVIVPLLPLPSVPVSARINIADLRCPRCRGVLVLAIEADHNDPALTRIGEAAVDAPRRELYKHIAAPDGPRIEYKHVATMGEPRRTYEYVPDAGEDTE